MVRNGSPGGVFVGLEKGGDDSSFCGASSIAFYDAQPTLDDAVFLFLTADYRFIAIFDS